MISASQRALLGRQALVAWNEAARLRRQAADLVASSIEKLQTAGELHRKAADLLAASVDKVQVTRDLGWRSLQRFEPKSRLSDSETELQALVDRAILSNSPKDEAAWANGKGAGLAASISFSTLVRLEQLLGRRLGYVAGAHDAGTALGLAIVGQPDIAVVDTRLDVANGTDLVIVLPMYAPRTKTLLLTDNDDQAAKAKLFGIDVMSRRFSDDAVLSWIFEAAA